MAHLPLQPYLSVVFTGRNDLDEPDFLKRMQLSVSVLLEQLRYYRVPSELIVAEWNPPANQPRLRDLLKLPYPGPCAVRIVEVPNTCETVARNAAIRRALGRFVLSTSAGMLFSGELIEYIADQRLKDGRIYRVDRHDVAANVPAGSVDKQLAWCDRNLVRVHTAGGVFPVMAEAAFPLLGNDIASQGGSLMLGAGWFQRELDGSRPFRWFSNNAEIVIQPDSKRVLAIDLEAGPRVKMGPTTFDVLDDHGASLLSVSLARRRVINVPLPERTEPYPLRLRVSDARARDPRALNVRVFGLGLYDVAAVARPWTMPQRIWWMLTGSMGNSLLPEDTKRDAASLHLTACGDFILLARKHWLDLRGLVESSEFSGDRTALFCQEAHRRGIEEHVLEYPLRVYCIGGEHGSMPDSGSDADQVPSPVTSNSEDWGLAKVELRSALLLKSRKTARRRRATKFARVVPEALLVRILRSIPRPPLPEPGAFSNSHASEGPLPPLVNPPKISIVTPSFQQGPFLEWTMRSVLEQEYPNLEYVVMDGGSTDETTEILARYKDRLAHSESSRDDGQADAVARGFQHTTGEIMAYLNSDDLLAPGALDFVARYFAEHPEVDAVYSHRVFVDDRNIVTRHWILPPHRDWMMQRWDYIPQETCFWRRRIYEKVGGVDPSFRFALDYDLFVRFMQHGRMERADRFLGAFREHPSSKTTLQEGAHPEVIRVQKEYGIRVNEWHRFPQLTEYELLEIRSRKFAARGRKLPGALPGIGYDYDLVWRGRLNGHHNSSRNTAGIHRT